MFNEEDSVGPLWEKVEQALKDENLQYELILVDDGSSDRTFERAESIAMSDHRVRVIKFRGNFGQTPAMAAGIDFAHGEVLVTMDGDLQNDPADIPEFLSKMNEGYDIVVGWRHKRKDKLITRKIPSKVANWIIGRVTGVPIKDNGCSLKAYRASVIKKVPLYSEMHRFIPAMTSLSGARVAEIKVRHHARQHGESKYGLSRIYKVALDIIAIKTIIGFHGRPLVWFAKFAVPFVVAAVFLLPFALLSAYQVRPELALTLGGMCLITAATGTFFLVLGILGELVFKMGEARLEKWASLTATIGNGE